MFLPAPGRVGMRYRAWRPFFVLARGCSRTSAARPSLCPTPMPQGVSYVHHDHKPAIPYIRTIIPDDMGIPLPASPGPIGVGLCRLSRNVGVTEFYEVRYPQAMPKQHQR